MVRPLKTFLLSILLCFMCGPVFACAVLIHGDPKVGSVVTTPISHVTLTFSGKIFPDKSTLEVIDAKGQVVSSGKAYGSDTTLSVAVKSLSPGIYKVRWNTWCECLSYTPGDYKFTVQ